MNFSESDFRHAMGCFTTGVTVVTTNNSGGLHGVTINSFASVSLNPFLVLFSLDKKAHIYEHFIDIDKFAINILSEKQINISRNFAHPSSANWNEAEHNILSSGNPVFKDSIAYIDCVKENTYSGGDHTIFIGRVTDLKILSDEKPLLYSKGRYTALGEMI